MPYRGLDEWTAPGARRRRDAADRRRRALLAFWPRRGGRTGFPVAALFLLLALYVVPAVVLDFEGEFLRGAVLAVLMLAFLRLEKLGVDDAPAAGIAAVAAALAALLAAPALDGRGRGGTTSAGRSTAPSARAVDVLAGTTTTARSTGRATGASCCA